MDLSSLPEDLRRFVSRQLEAGRYESLDELCSETLRRYAQEESYFDDSAGEFKAFIARAIAYLKGSEAKLAGLQATSPDGPLYRIARPPDPWTWPDWANVGSDGTLGNRWDDLAGVYRVLYASSSRLGARMEERAEEPEISGKKCQYTY